LVKLTIYKSIFLFQLQEYLQSTVNICRNCIMDHIFINMLHMGPIYCTIIHILFHTDVAIDQLWRKIFLT